MEIYIIKLFQMYIILVKIGGPEMQYTPCQFKILIITDTGCACICFQRGSLASTQRKKGTKTVPLGHHFGKRCLFQQIKYSALLESGTKMVPQGHCFSTLFSLSAGK